jgi:hypothetical protein
MKSNRFITNWIYVYFKQRGEVVSRYTSSNPLLRWLFFQRLHCSLKLVPTDISYSDKIVDFGGADSFFSLLLSNLGYGNITVVDKNDGVLKRGRQMIEDYNRRFDNTYTLNFKTELEEFDNIKLLIGLDVFEHFSVENLRKFLSRISPEYILVNLPTENLFYNALNFFKREPDHKTRYFKVIELFNEHGFEVVRRGYLLGLFNQYLLRNKMQHV